jgi:hypothetical protein
MGEIAKHTDLSHEEPGPRAIVDLPHEDIEFRTKMPLLGGEIEMKARVAPGSPLSSAIITVALFSIGCGCVGTLFAIGAPLWIAIGSILLPVITYATASHCRIKSK